MLRAKHAPRQLPDPVLVLLARRLFPDILAADYDPPQIMTRLAMAFKNAVACV